MRIITKDYIKISTSYNPNTNYMKFSKENKSHLNFTEWIDDDGLNTTVSEKIAF
jgi:hypothetical protein